MDETTNPAAQEPATDVLTGWTDAPPAVTTTEDVLKTVPAKATIGFSSLFGMPGAATNWMQNKVLQGAGALMGPEFEADIRRGLLEGLTDEEKAAVESGRAVRTKEGLFPTLIGQEEKTKNALEYTNYEPQTAPGRYAGAAAEFVGGSLPLAVFAPETLPAKIGTVAKDIGYSSIAGVGSEAGADWAKSIGAPEYEGYFRLIGAIAAPTAAKYGVTNAADLFQGIGKSVAPGANLIDDKVAELLMKDLQSGSSPMTLEQVRQEIARGNAPALFDMAGKETRSYLQSVYKLTPEITAEIDNLNSLTKGRAAEAATQAVDYLDSAYGNIGSFNAEKQALEAAGLETTAAYKLSRTSPNAQNMWTPELSTLAYENPYIQQAMTDVNKLLEGRRAGKMQADMYNVDLSYWDMVKKRLDDYINKVNPNNKLNASNADSIQYGAAVDAKKDLLKLLDTAVPEYADARGANIDKLGVKNAPEAGEKLFGLRKTRDFEESMEVFNSLKPDQQELFRRGFLRSVYDQISNNKSLGGIVDKLTSPSGQKYYRQVLGDTAYNDIVGVTAAAQAKSGLKAIEESTLFKRLGEGALKAKDVLQTATAVGTTVAGGTKSVTAGAVAAGAAGVLDTIKNSIVFNYAERKVAPQVIQLLKSTDPEDVKRLGELIATNRDAANAFGKINGSITNFGLSLGLSGKEQAQSEEKKIQSEWSDPTALPAAPVVDGQAAGGRIERKAGGRVANSISAEVVRTRALLGNKTASILSIPDDAIISALNLARKN